MLQPKLTGVFSFVPKNLPFSSKRILKGFNSLEASKNQKSSEDIHQTWFYSVIYAFNNGQLPNCFQLVVPVIEFYLKDKTEFHKGWDNLSLKDKCSFFSSIGFIFISNQDKKTKLNIKNLEAFMLYMISSFFEIIRTPSATFLVTSQIVTSLVNLYLDIDFYQKKKSSDVGLSLTKTIWQNFFSLAKAGNPLVKKSLLEFKPSVYSLYTNHAWMFFLCLFMRFKINNDFFLLENSFLLFKSLAFALTILNKNSNEQIKDVQTWTKKDYPMFYTPILKQL